MNLEQAIGRTWSVIGLPKCGAGAGFIRGSLGQTWALIAPDGTPLEESIAFAILRDHAQQACDERGWCVHYDATPMAYMVHDADGKLLAESGDRLDAMLTALEADGETKGASDES